MTQVSNSSDNKCLQVAYYHEFRDRVDFVFVDHPCYHNRGNDLYSGSRLDVAFRCALLSKAALEAPWHVPCDGVPYGDSSLVYIANDWHAGLLPVYLKVPSTITPLRMHQGPL